MTDDPDDEPSHSSDSNSVTIEASPGTVTITPKTAKTWVVPTLRADLLENADELKEGIAESDGYIDFLDEYQDTVVVFFAIAREILTDQTKELFEKEIVVEDYRDGTVVTYVGKGRYDVFRHFGIIENGLNEKIEDTMDFRGDLVHNPKERHTIENLQGLSNRIDKALEAIDELDEKLSDGD